MTLLATFVASVLILILLLVFSIRLRSWIRDMRRDIYDIRDEVRAVKLVNERFGGELKSIAIDGVNASCISALGFNFPVFMGGPSIDTHHVRNMIFNLQERKPRAILELGSGSSTVIIARVLSLMGASPDIHIAVDHELRFLNNAQELARLNDVAHLVRFEHCPLQQLDGFPNPWYSRMPELAETIKFDFVVVDGPPAYAEGDGRTREPALTVLRPYLAKNAMVILDDANRPGELAVIQAWLKKYPEFSLYHAKEGKGVAILTLNY